LIESCLTRFRAAHGGTFNVASCPVHPQAIDAPWRLTGPFVRISASARSMPFIAAREAF
jgi:hypothetical protein